MITMTSSESLFFTKFADVCFLCYWRKYWESCNLFFFSQIANETNSVSDANLSHFRINCLWNIRTDWIYILNHTVRWCAHYQSDNEVFLSIDSNTFSLCTCNRCCRCCVASYCSSARIKCLFHSFFCVGLRCDWRREWLIRATKTVRY